MSDLLYSTELGKYYIGKCEETIRELDLQKKVQLILTSPPFPLNNKKQYGNLNGEEYLKWFTGLAELFSSVLAPNGSIVIEMGNAWEKNRPVQSLLHLNSLLSFVNNEKAGLRLCQEFICYNPARLPSPAQWVTIHRIRAIDSFTHVWWISNSDYPKADNRRVLRPYSKSMKKLLKSGKFNSGKRPSEHVISEKAFLTDNQNIQRIKLVVPTKGIALDGEIDFVSSVRRTIYEFFISQPERNGFMDALKWLIFEEYSSSDNSKIWHLATCPHCSVGVDIQKKNVQNDYTITCPHCGDKIHLTDILRLHEVIDNELGAGGILGYLTSAVEQIIIVYLIKQMLNIRPSLLSQTLFVKDGPLAFFGQTANLHKPM